MWSSQSSVVGSSALLRTDASTSGLETRSRAGAGRRRASSPAPDPGIIFGRLNLARAIRSQAQQRQYLLTPSASAASRASVASRASFASSPSTGGCPFKDRLSAPPEKPSPRPQGPAATACIVQLDTPLASAAPTSEGLRWRSARARAILRRWPRLPVGRAATPPEIREPPQGGGPIGADWATGGTASGDTSSSRSRPFKIFRSLLKRVGSRRSRSRGPACDAGKRSRGRSLPPATKSARSASLASRTPPPTPPPPTPPLPTPASSLATTCGTTSACSSSADSFSDEAVQAVVEQFSQPPKLHQSANQPTEVVVATFHGWARPADQAKPNQLAFLASLLDSQDAATAASSVISVPPYAPAPIPQQPPPLALPRLAQPIVSARPLSPPPHQPVPAQKRLSASLPQRQSLLAPPPPTFAQTAALSKPKRACMMPYRPHRGQLPSTPPPQQPHKHLPAASAPRSPAHHQKGRRATASAKSSSAATAPPRRWALPAAEPALNKASSLLQKRPLSAIEMKRKKRAAELQRLEQAVRNLCVDSPDDSPAPNCQAGSPPRLPAKSGLAAESPPPGGSSGCLFGEFESDDGDDDNSIVSFPALSGFPFAAAKPQPPPPPPQPPLPRAIQQPPQLLPPEPPPLLPTLPPTLLPERPSPLPLMPSVHPVAPTSPPSPPTSHSPSPSPSPSPPPSRSPSPSSPSNSPKVTLYSVTLPDEESIRDASTLSSASDGSGCTGSSSTSQRSRNEKHPRRRRKPIRPSDSSLASSATEESIEPIRLRISWVMPAKSSDEDETASSDVDDVDETDATEKPSSPPPPPTPPPPLPPPPSPPPPPPQPPPTESDSAAEAAAELLARLRSLRPPAGMEATLRAELDALARCIGCHLSPSRSSATRNATPSRQTRSSRDSRRSCSGSSSSSGADDPDSWSLGDVSEEPSCPWQLREMMELYQYSDDERRGIREHHQSLRQLIDRRPSLSSIPERPEEEAVAAAEAAETSDSTESDEYSEADEPSAASSCQQPQRVADSLDEEIRRLRLLLPQTSLSSRPASSSSSLSSPSSASSSGSLSRRRFELLDSSSSLALTDDATSSESCRVDKRPGRRTYR